MKQTLGQKLRHLRTSREYTQQQLCDYLHIERSAYANYETDKREPSRHILLQIADFYRINVEYLLRDDYTGCPAMRSPESDRVILIFNLLEPQIRTELLDYMCYRLKKQRTAKKS